MPKVHRANFSVTTGTVVTENTIAITVRFAIKCDSEASI
jgi:hypothetical protein